MSCWAHSCLRVGYAIDKARCCETSPRVGLDNASEHSGIALHQAQAARMKSARNGRGGRGIAGDLEQERLKLHAEEYPTGSGVALRGRSVLVERVDASSINRFCRGDRDQAAKIHHRADEFLGSPLNGRDR